MKKIDYKTAYENVMIANDLLKSNMSTMQDVLNKLYTENQRLKEIEKQHKTLNGKLRKENEKLTIALQNIQEDYDIRIEENERLKENLLEEKKDFKEANDYAFKLLDYKSRCEKAIDKLAIKQARFINEKDYILDDNDLDEIMYILQNGSDSNEN